MTIEDTYIIHFVGNGDMKNFSDESPALWNALKSKITAVMIADGVTSLGSGTLSAATNLTTINGVNTKEAGYILFPAQLKNWGGALYKSGLSGELRFPVGSI